MSSPRVRLLAACAVLSGLVVVGVLGVALQRSPATTAATAAHCLDRSALARFQLARSEADLRAVFGPAESPCRPLVVDALVATQRADFRALIPAYTLFFIAAALALAGRRSVWTRLAVAATVVAATANVLEDRVQLQILRSVEDGAGLLVPLVIWTLTKFAAFAVCAAALGGWALTHLAGNRAARRLGLVVGLVWLVPVPATLLGALDPHRLGLLMAGAFFLFALTLFGATAGVLVRPGWAKG
jgi:hypothetical protein